MSRSLSLAVAISLAIAARAFAVADLQVQLTVPAKSAIGANVYMALGVANNGPDSGPFTLTYTPPPGYTFLQIVSIQTSYGPLSCTHPAVGANAGLTCTGSMSHLGQGPDVSFAYQVASSVAPGTSMVSSAAVSSAGDPNAGNDTQSATSIATAIPDLHPSLSLPATYTPGLPFHATMGLRNNGPSSAANWFLDTHFDAGFYVTAITQTAGPAATCTPSGVSCSGASLGAGEQATFDLTVSPSASLTAGAHAYAEGALLDFNYYTAPVNAAAARVEVTDIAATSTAPATAKLGDDLAFNVLLQNVGPSDAPKVTVTWTTPAGTTFLGADTAGATCSVPPVGGAGTATCTLYVAAGSPSYAGFHARVTGSGTIVNSATASCASDGNSANNTTTASTTVSDTPHADVALSMTAPAYALAGRPASVQLTFHNAGPSTAQAVSANLTLPADLILDPSSDCGNPCAAGDMTVGATVKKTLIVVPGSAASAQINAAASSTTPDLDTANNSAGVTLHVYPPLADLQLTIADIAAPVAPGGEITLAPQIVNHGPAPASPTLSIDLPAGTKLLLGAGCTTAGAAATCTASELSPGGAATFTLTAQAPTAAGTYSLAFHAASALSDPNPADNQASASVTVAGTPPPPADLALNIHPADAVAAPGAQVAFAIVVENRGPNPAGNVIVSVPNATLLSPVPASLDVGQSVTIQAVAIAPQSGSANVDAAVTCAAPDPDLANNAASLRIVVVDHPRRRAAGH